MRVDKVEHVTGIEAVTNEPRRINPAQYTQQKSFSDVLNGELEKNSLQFSKHANMRLNSRNINLSNEQIRRVEDGVMQASQKGVRDSLVIVDNVALVVNVRSGTVITAVDKQQDTDKNIFTNIDGAVIV